MLVYIAGLNRKDLSVEYLRTEELTILKEVVLYEDYEMIVPSELNPYCVKGEKIIGSDGKEEIQIVFDEKMTYAWTELRRKRQKLLSDCDWTQFPDVKLSPEKKEAWLVYRQTLRDLPNIVKNPLNVVWPEKPQ